MEGTTAEKLKLGRENCHRNLQVKYPSAFQAGNTTMVLDKSPTDFFCFYICLVEHGALPRYLLAPARRLDLLTAPQAPTWISASPKRRQNTAFPQPRGGSAPFSQEQNAGFPFPEAGHGRHRQQARMPRGIHREAIPAAGRAAGTALSDPGWHQPEAPGMTYRVCRQRRPGPCPRRQRAPIPRASGPEARAGRGRADPSPTVDGARPPPRPSPAAAAGPAARYEERGPCPTAPVPVREGGNCLPSVTYREL